VELIPESEEVRRGTEALPAEGPMLDVLDLFMCPLTMEVMRNPSHYCRRPDLERREIQKWVALWKEDEPADWSSSWSRAAQHESYAQHRATQIIRQSGLLK
jgi:hypothetical protein